MSAAGSARHVIELLLLGHTLEAEAKLRELNAARRHGKQHRHGVQIARIEQYFRQTAGREPWPADFKPGQLIHFRELLGGLLDEMPLRQLLEDLKAEAVGKQSLLYFLSTDQGRRASRWEMLLCDWRERQLAEDKARWHAEAVAAYEQLFPTIGELGRPSWVIRLEDELKQLEHLLPLTTDSAARREMQQRGGVIRAALAKFDKGAQTQQTRT